MMKHGLVACAMLVGIGSGAGAQTGTSYRFQSGTATGTVWVLGENARRETEPGANGTAAGRVELWKDGGKQVFVLNPGERTYYEENAYLARMNVRKASVDTFRVNPPFLIKGVSDVKVDLKILPRPDMVAGNACRRITLAVFYVMNIGIAGTSESMPARVEGTEELCVMEMLNPLRLPFEHQLEWRTGHPQVDSAVAARLSAVKGIAVERKLKVTRRIEQGEPVSQMAGVLLSNIQEAAIAPERLEVPKDYRFQEPVITPPVRKDP